MDKNIVILLKKIFFEKNFIKKIEKNNFKIIVNDFNKYFF